MRLNRNYEAELNLKDLFFGILYRWRILLLVGLIAAAAFGFMEYRGFDKYHRKGELTPAEAKYESNMEDIRQLNADIDAYNGLIRNKSEYRKTSVLMNMDPTNIWTAEKVYLLNTEADPADPDAGTRAEEKILTVLSGALAEDAGEDKRTEVFGTGERKDTDLLASVCVSRSRHTVSVIGCGATAEEAGKRKEYADSLLQAAGEKLSEKFTLEALSDSVGTKTMLTVSGPDGEKAEMDLAAAQYALNQEIQTYEKQRDAYVKSRNSLKAQTSGKPSPKIVRQALLGFAVGICAAAVFFACLYFLGRRLKTGRELGRRYELALLGEVSHSRARRKGKGIDRLIEKLEFGKGTDLENELDSAASMIGRDMDGTEILLTGSLEEKALRPVYEGLAARLQEKGIRLTMQAEFPRNSKAVEASVKADAVILAEEKGKSRIRDLDRTAEILAAGNAKVLGAVLL